MDLGNVPAKNLQPYYSGQDAFLALQSIYKDNCAIINELFNELVDSNQIPPPPRKVGYYPYIALEIQEEHLNTDARFSYGVALEPGIYGTTITHPEIFQKYLVEQIDLLIKRHNVPVYVGQSLEPIPFPFTDDCNMGKVTAENAPLIRQAFAWPTLSRIHDRIANNASGFHESETLPLSLFSAERIDYSLARLHHYTATHPKHFQSFILLTNYQRYVNEFIEYAQDAVTNGDEYEAFVSPGEHILYNQRFFSEKESGEPSPALPQMPAYHLKRADGTGITFINIGVSPSNAKTITDHLAVLRPNCWIMLGHCAGLRRSQYLGDYVLAHAYVRDENVLDEDLPLSVPIPPIAEVQVALQDAVANVTGLKGRDLKTRMRTGTVYTTGNRNWELLTDELFNLFQQTRSIAVDMESATIAANGFRFRVPYGTLLCVSDKPIHGELKLRATANSFYAQQIAQHLRIGIETIDLLRAQGDALHSRKLRGFEEPPFR